MTTPHRTLREAAQMALDALLIGYHRGAHDAIAALREALAAPEPEPAAIADGTFNCDAPLGTLLYAAPPAAPAKLDARVAAIATDRDYWRERVLALESAAPAQPVVPPRAHVGKYDEVLVPFVSLMEAELHANSDKGDRPGWLSMTPEVALLEIYWHTAKLSAAVKNKDSARITEHSADVANMAMMLLDVCVGLPHHAQSNTQPSVPAQPAVPLTDGQIRQIVRDTFDVVPLPYDITFARAIEAAHGITGGKP